MLLCTVTWFQVDSAVDSITETVETYVCSLNVGEQYLQKKWSVCLWCWGEVTFARARGGYSFL